MGPWVPDGRSRWKELGGLGLDGLARVCRGTRKEEVALACVARERRRTLALGAGLVEAAESSQQVAAHARQEMIVLQRRFLGQRVDQLEPGSRTVRHPDRDRAIELHDRRWHDPGERIVERRDASPVGPLWRA